MLGLNTSIHKQIREDVCQYMSNLDEDNKKRVGGEYSWERLGRLLTKKLS